MADACTALGLTVAISQTSMLLIAGVFIVGVMLGLLMRGR